MQSICLPFQSIVKGRDKNKTIQLRPSSYGECLFPVAKR